MSLLKIRNISLKMQSIASHSSSKLLLLAIMWIVGTFVLLLTYHLACNGTFPNYLFWCGVLLSGGATFLAIIAKDTSRTNIIVFLVAFGVTTYLLHFLPSLSSFRFQDELINSHLTDMIFQLGSERHIGEEMVSVIARSYPGIEFIVVSLKSLTGLSTFYTSVLLIAAIHCSTLVLIYLFFEIVSSSRFVAAIGTFIYSTNILFVFFHTEFVYETLGIFFMISLLLIIAKLHLTSADRFAFLLLAILTLFALVITHHLSAYMFILFLILLQIAHMYRHRKNVSLPREESYLSILSLSIIIAFAWLMFKAASTPEYLGVIFIERVSKILELSVFSGQQIDVFAQTLIPEYEKVIDNFIYIPVILVLSAYGAFLIRRYRYFSDFMFALIVYGPLFFLLTLPLVVTSGAEFSTRLWGFLFVAISPIIGVAFHKMICSIGKNRFWFRRVLVSGVIVLSIVVLIMGGISIGRKPIHREPITLSPKLASGSGALTRDLFDSASWLLDHFGENNVVVGDKAACWIFGNQGMQKVRSEDSWKVFLPRTFDYGVLSYLGGGLNVNFIVADKRITKVLAQGSGYFNNQELYSESDPEYGTYGLAQPLPSVCLDKFDNADFLNKIQSNGNISIYEVNQDKAQLKLK